MQHCPLSSMDWYTPSAVRLGSRNNAALWGLASGFVPVLLGSGNVRFEGTVSLQLQAAINVDGKGNMNAVWIGLQSLFSPGLSLTISQQREKAALSCLLISLSSALFSLRLAVLRKAHECLLRKEKTFCLVASSEQDHAGVNTVLPARGTALCVLSSPPRGGVAGLSRCRFCSEQPRCGKWDESRGSGSSRQRQREHSSAPWRAEGSLQSRFS